MTSNDQATVWVFGLFFGAITVCQLIWAWQAVRIAQAEAQSPYTHEPEEPEVGDRIIPPQGGSGTAPPSKEWKK